MPIERDDYERAALAANWRRVDEAAARDASLWPLTKTLGDAMPQLGFELS